MSGALDGACTNMAEEYFFRLRRADLLQHAVYQAMMPIRCLRTKL